MWKPATEPEVVTILLEDLATCAPDLRAFFDATRVPPHRAPLVRYGVREEVFVVARHEGRAVYWEDVEEGWNVSPVGPDGTLLEHGCNQDDLALALRRLRDGDSAPSLGPAVPVP